MLQLYVNACMLVQQDGIDKKGNLFACTQLFDTCICFFTAVEKFLVLVICSALTTYFHILVSRGGGWLGISRTIKF